MECPDEEALLQLATGTLAAERATELERHLSTCADCCAVLAEAAHELPDHQPDVPRASDVTPESEGRYQLRRELGEGAEGRVFAAWDHHLAREVALKVPHRDLTDRPLREARLVARLDHPGIATVFEIGRRADGSLYSVQRLVHAEHGPSSLRAALQAAPSLEMRLRLLPRLLQVAEAVGYAHARGVVHRDLKPENIALGDGGETVVLDWGLAILLEAPEDAPRGVGTPGYMSPEQQRGELVGPPADVYALGVMLDELLEPAPVEQRPRPLVAIAQRARAADPAQRYATGSELAAELTAWLSGGVVQAHDYAVSELLARSFRRHRQAIGFLALIAVVAVIAAGLISRSQRRAESALAETLLQKASQSQSQGAWDAAAVYSAAARALSDSEAARMSLAATSDRSQLRARRTLTTAGPVSSLASEAGTQAIAAGLADGSILVMTRGVLRTVSAATGSAVSAMVFSHDGARLYAASTDGRLVEWTLSSNTPRVLASHLDSLNAIALDPKGALLATAGEDGFVEILRLETGEKIARWQAHEAPIYALAIAGDSLVTGSWDSHIRIWSLDGSRRSELEGHSDAVQALAISPDGARLASASRDGSVRVWPFPSGGPAQVLAGHTRKVAAVAWLDGEHLQSTGDDGQVRSWAMRGGDGPRPWQCVSLENLDEAGTQLVALPGGASMVGGVRGSLFRLAPPRVLALQLPWRERVSHLDVEDGGLLMIEPSSFVVRDLETDEVRSREPMISVNPAQVRVLPGGRRFWAGYRLDQTAAVYLRDEQGHDEEIAQVKRVWSLPLDPDARWGAVLGGAPTLQLRSMIDGSAGVTLGGHESDIFGAALGRTVAVTASYDRTLGVFALPGGERVQTLRGHWHGVRAVALSPDESLIASGSWDQTVRLWARSSGTLEATLYGHRSYVTAVAFSPSGKRLASVSWDGTLLVWDVGRREVLLQQDAVENEPRALQWFGEDVLRIGGTRMHRVELSPRPSLGLVELELTRGVRFDGTSATRVDFGIWE